VKKRRVCPRKSAALRSKVGGCAKKSQNIIDIFTNSSDIFTNSSDIFENISDNLSFEGRINGIDADSG